MPMASRKESVNEEIPTASSLGDALLYATMCIVGLPVEVQIKDGSLYCGILHTACFEKDHGRTTVQGTAYAAMSYLWLPLIIAGENQTRPHGLDQPDMTWLFAELVRRSRVCRRNWVNSPIGCAKRPRHPCNVRSSIHRDLPHPPKFPWGRAGGPLDDGIRLLQNW